MATVDLEISVSFPEGFADGIAGALQNHLADFFPSLVDGVVRDLLSGSCAESTGRADHLVIAPRLSVSDFDAEFSAALQAFRLDLHERIVRHGASPSSGTGHASHGGVESITR